MHNSGITHNDTLPSNYKRCINKITIKTRPRYEYMMKTKSTTIRVNYSTKDYLRDFINKDTVSMDSIISDLIQFKRKEYIKIIDK